MLIGEEEEKKNILVTKNTIAQFETTIKRQHMIQIDIYCVWLLIVGNIQTSIKPIKCGSNKKSSSKFYYRFVYVHSLQ